MNGLKKLRLPVTVERTAFSDSDHVIITFPDQTIEPWTLGLCLLKEELLSILQLEDQSETFRLVVRRDADLGPGERPFAKASGRSLELRVGPTELEMWLHFFLRTIRDGVAEVDHLDVETTAVEENARPVELTLRVLAAREPLTPDEIRRQLGI